MDMELSAEQADLQANARRFLKNECPLEAVRSMEKDRVGYSPKIWAEMARLGWTGLPLPEAYGGSELNNLDVAILMHEFGRVMLPSPYIPTVLLAGGALAALGSDAQKQRYLPRIISGDIVLGFALQEGINGGYGPSSVAATATPGSDGGYVLKGKKRFVEFAEAAERILVVARTLGSKDSDGLALFLVDPKAAGVSLKHLATIARDAQFDIELNDVKVAKEYMVGTPGKVWPMLDGVIQRAVVAFSSVLAGAAERALELATDYAKQRVQFGKPIGSFMSIQHYLAQMAIDNTAVETMVYYAAWTIDQGAPARVEVAHAKLGASHACRAGSAKGAEIYGGMGFVDEVDIAYYNRRGKQWQLSMGEPRFWEKMLIDALLERQAA